MNPLFLKVWKISWFHNEERQANMKVTMTNKEGFSSLSQVMTLKKRTKRTETRFLKKTTSNDENVST